MRAQGWGVREGGGAGAGEGEVAVGRLGEVGVEVAGRWWVSPTFPADLPAQEAPNESPDTGLY